MRERERVMQRPKWNPTTFLKEKKKKKMCGGRGESEGYDYEDMAAQYI